MVSRGDWIGGGASRGAEELARWLIEAGHSVTHFCWRFTQEPAPFQRQLGGPWPVRKTVQKLHAASRYLGFPHLLPFEYYAQLKWVQDSFDLFHFHDLIGTISYSTLIALSRQKPVFFTVHDFSAFTGGCVYPMQCAKYETRCGECPQLGSWPMHTKIDRTGHMQDLRRRAAARRGIQYIFPCEWIERKMVEVMPLARPPVRMINSIDPEKIMPTAKNEARQKLGLPLDRPVVLISAHFLSYERKGARYALEAIRQVADMSPVVMTLGNSDPAIEGLIGGVRHTSFGFVPDPEKMALIYSAADVYLFTSIADNCPYTVLEAMGSGTATVGFATGGVPELVASEEAGLLVPVEDQAGLSAALRRALQDRNLTQKWGNQARLRIEKYFNKRLFVEKMTHLYEEVRQDWKAES